MLWAALRPSGASSTRTYIHVVRRGGDPAAMVQQLMQALNASKAKKDTKGDKKIAERIEAAATSATSVEGSDGVADGAENEPPLLRLDAERAVSREAVAQQSRQLAWRCQEIRALDDKIASAGGMTRGARRA